MKNENATNPCLHELIEQQARRSPDRVAVKFERQQLTYGELERRASRLAARLRALGVGPDVLVGLFIERSLEMMVGILGVLKAGGAYVPLDPSYPRERLSFMCSDAGLRLLLTHSSLAARLPAGAPETVRLDELHWHRAEAPAPGGALARPEHLAYVIYTSGSTGRPKGVCVEHRNIVNYVLGIADRLQLEPGMSYASVSTPAADLGNTVIFPALVTGGCLHLLSQERAQSPRLLAEYFMRERIDVLKITPSHLAALHGGSDGTPVMPARRLVLGGEASRLELIEQLRRLSPHCEICNHYGPTETTVGVLTYRVGAKLPATPGGTLPLGHALPHTRIYLLDARGEPVPQGEKGELCIGGAGVARGYLNRPELTAERFVRDPFCAERGARMYRTGDLARCLPDGNIEFCGRVDHQVKVRGYRVELGEVEAALRDHGGVEEAVAIARENGSHDRQLVAFVVPRRGPQSAAPQAALTGATLRAYLKLRLPDYMVPSAFALLDNLPLAANGKIDRQALAASPLDSAQRVPAGCAPRSETERALAAIWTELLKLEAIGIDDDVFDLGAHSLLAMRALARIGDVLGVNLPMRNLFEHPTIAGLAEVIDGLGWLAKAKGASRDAGDRQEIVL